MNEVLAFYVDVLTELLTKGAVSTSDSVLVVCGGALDVDAMKTVGFSDVTVTNLDNQMPNHYQDAEQLSFGDGSFDLVVVHAGLHHCRSPHRALLEMYRVARKCALAFEARNSLLMRVAVKAGLTMDYELEAVTSGDFKAGGLRNGPIPNFIYRWTECEVVGTISSCDPSHIQEIEFFYRLRLPLLRFRRTGRPLLATMGAIAALFARLLIRIAPRQCNEFAFAIRKTGELKPWMRSETELSRDYAVANKRMYG